MKNSDKRVYARQYMKMTVADIADRVAELRVLEVRDREAAAAGAAFCAIARRRASELPG